MQRATGGGRVVISAYAEFTFPVAGLERPASTIVGVRHGVWQAHTQRYPDRRRAAEGQPQAGRHSRGDRRSGPETMDLQNHRSLHGGGTSGARLVVRASSRIRAAGPSAELPSSPHPSDAALRCDRISLACRTLRHRPGLSQRRRPCKKPTTLLALCVEQLIVRAARRYATRGNELRALRNRRRAFALCLSSTGPTLRDWWYCAPRCSRTVRPTRSGIRC